MLSALTVKAIFHTAETAVEYIPLEPLYCPICLKFRGEKVRAFVTSTPAPQLRYAKCPVCSVTFKAITKEESLPKPVINTETATKPKRKRNIKAEKPK